MYTNILPELDDKEYIFELQNQYQIEFCKVEDIDNLVEFIKNNWAQNHVFVKSRKLLDWQHYDEKNARYNFIIAKERETGEIHSILGFIPLYQSEDDSSTCDVWPCIWKVKDGINVKGLGVSLYKFLKDSLPIRSICILGISDIALSIYKKWNFKTGHINQYYLINPMENNFELISGIEKDEISSIVTEKRFVNIDKDMFLNTQFDFPHKPKRMPFKNKDYYVKRYFEHPIYTYKAYAIEQDNDKKGIIFVREIIRNKKKCIRIVDFYGEIESLYNMKYHFQQMLIRSNAEYIDFVNVGYSEEHFRKMGFVKKDVDKKVIVPNYFEPFMLKNIELDYAWKTIDNMMDDEFEVIFFKADADQDRPNII